MGEDFRYISLFSGIEAATVAWESCEWKPVAFSDFDDFPSAVLAHHYPDIPNLGDVTEVNWDEYRGKADLVVGGSPCQSFSVAGQRLGLADPRGNLALHFLRVVEAVQPRWFLFENVAGLLSSDGGRDFATFLGEVANIGYGFAYRVLDAKHFGVAQRRRRVFVVGHIGGDWRRAASVLFERESLCGNPTPRKAEREGTTTDAGSGPNEESEAPLGTRGISWDGKDHISTITAKAHDQRMPDKAHFLGVIEPEPTLGFDHTFGQNYGIYEDESPTLKVNGAVPTSPAVAFDWKNIIQTNPSEESTDPLTREGSLAVFDARGNGDGDVSNTLVGDHQGRVTDYTAVAVEQQVLHGPINNTLDASYGKGPGERAGVERQIVGESIAIRSVEGVDLFNQELTGEEHAPLRTAQGHGAPAVAIGIDGQLNADEEEIGALRRGGDGGSEQAVAIQDTSSRDKAQNGKGWKDDGSAYTLDTKGLQGANIGMAVRRLTPIECERLQGFPDNYTQIAWKGKAVEDCPDGHRFKALGNSMAVPVMRWLGQRIALVDAIPIEGEAHNTGTDWL